MERREFLKTAGMCGFCSCAGAALLAQEGVSEERDDPRMKELKGYLDFVRRRYAKLIEILGLNLKPEMRKKVLEDLGRECAGEYKALFERHKNDLEGFLETVGKEWAERTEYDAKKGTVRIVGRKTGECFCPLVKKGLTPKEVCDCSLGWQKEGFKIILGKEVEAKVEESIVRGGERCTFLLKIPVT